MRVQTYLVGEKPAKLEDLCRVNPEFGDAENADVFIDEMGTTGQEQKRNM
jgi:hypothetical protein